jgi:hypothetical protein
MKVYSVDLEKRKEEIRKDLLRRKPAVRVILIISFIEFCVTGFCIAWFVLAGENKVIGGITGILSVLNLICWCVVFSNNEGEIDQLLAIAYFMSIISSCGLGLNSII